MTTKSHVPGNPHLGSSEEMKILHPKKPSVQASPHIFNVPIAHPPKVLFHIYLPQETRASPSRDQSGAALLASSVQTEAGRERRKRRRREEGRRDPLK